MLPARHSLIGKGHTDVMNRLWTALVLLLLLPVSTWAQQRGTYELLTVDATARSISTATLRGMAMCIVVVETANVRLRSDATAPTAAVGTPVPAGSTVRFDNITTILNTQFIRTSATDATLHVNCFPSDNNVAISGTGSASGSSGTEATLAEQEAQTGHLLNIKTNTDTLTNLAQDPDDQNPVLFNTAATYLLITGVPGEEINGKGLLFANGTTTVTIVTGTGALCATDQADVATADLTLAEKPYMPFEFHIPAGNSLCAINSAAVMVKGQVVFAQHP
jgi:hypothetical protein